MADLSITSTDVRIVKEIESITLPMAETLTPGQAARIDTSTGKATKANGSSAAEARAQGIVAEVAGNACKILRRGSSRSETSLAR